MAELADAEKNELSHRAVAVRKLKPHLVSLVAQRTREAERIGREQ
jgi:hypothetical protein